MEKVLDLLVISFTTAEQWRQWLAKNYGQTEGIWLKIAKKASGKKSPSYAEALDEALCYGWIDGQKRAYDEQYFVQKFSPRRAKSIWSKINVEKVAQLTATGRMHPSGLKAVEAAKKDGRWERAYDSGRTMAIPPDFQAALDQNPRAKSFFASLNKTNVYAFLWRIQTTNKAENRQAKIKKFITMLNKGEKLY
jgi:uncharacterized protein YdeI (YjbR/CyaY-like superfamily)